MKSLCVGRMPAKVLCLGALVAMLPLVSACVGLASFWAVMTGGDVITPEYQLTKGPLLILLDDRESRVSEPRVLRDVHQTISEKFLEYRINRMVVPFQDWRRLQQTTKDYDRLSIREIGEKLGADQVLYLRVERFTLRAEPGAPVFKGEFVIRAKVLSTERKGDVRLWPRQEIGRRVSVDTPAESSEGGNSSADVARKLAVRMGKEVAKLFYEHRELDE